jgi:hypothetical protein
MIDQTPLVSGVVDNGNAMLFNITGERVEELLQNITLSMLTISHATVHTTVLQSQTVNYYAFDRRLNLILPYFLSLAVTLVFVVLGMLALFRNGVSASSGGFLQILCTTRGNETLDNATIGASLGGRENVSRELREMKVAFGELPTKEGAGGGAIRRAGFGHPHEITPLIKKELYGGAKTIG